MHYDGFELLSIPVGVSLRTSSWAPVSIRYDADGLYISHHNRVWVQNFKIRGWAPEPSWRIGFGARGESSWDEYAGEPGSRDPERHWIDDLRISSGVLIAGKASIPPAAP